MSRRVLGDAEGSGYQRIPHHPTGAVATGLHPAGAQADRVGWTAACTQFFLPKFGFCPAYLENHGMPEWAQALASR